MMTSNDDPAWFEMENSYMRFLLFVEVLGMSESLTKMLQSPVASAVYTFADRYPHKLRRPAIIVFLESDL